MIKVGGVCIAVLVVVIYSEKCNALETNIENVFANKLENFEENSIPELLQPIETSSALESKTKYAGLKKQPMNDHLGLLFARIDKGRGSKNLNMNRISQQSIEAITKPARTKRVLRQAHLGYSPLYPKLPSAPPYNQINPSGQYQPQFNQQWQTSNRYNNYGQSGFNGFTPNNYTNPYNPLNRNNQTYGQYPSYDRAPTNNPLYNANTLRPGSPYNQYSYSTNVTYYQPTSPGYRLPYNQTGQNQFNNSSYSAYTPDQRPINNTFRYNPSQRPPYYTPGKHQFNNTQPQYSTSYPQYSPNNQPFIYNSTNQRTPYFQPGKYPYNNSNSSYWPGRPVSNASYTNIPSQRPPYNASNGQNPQHFNSYTNNYPGYTTNSYNKPNQTPTYRPPNNQFPNNNSFHTNYPYYNGTNTFGLAKSYNPSIPNQPPYSSLNRNNYPPNWNGTNYDPTQVSPEYYSYPH